MRIIASGTMCRWMLCRRVLPDKLRSSLVMRRKHEACCVPSTCLTGDYAANYRAVNRYSSELHQPPKLYSPTDLPVLEAKELMLSTVMEMDCGVPRAREALDALREALDYALRAQLRLRLLGVLRTYQLLAEEPDRNLPLAALIGWCVEMAECYHLVIDDMVDQSPIRRGRPALHTRPDVGWRAIFDAVLFEKAACFVLKQRLGSHHVLQPLLELFDECNFRCMLGEMFDVLTTAKTSAGQQLRQPSFDRYWAAGIFKSSAFGLELPIRAGMFAAGVEDKSLHQQAKQACVALGQIYMARNDYNDCFSCPTLTGKVGTDIVEHKHTWLLITALKLASPEQVEHIQAHIGRGSPGGPDEAAVKAVYKELNIQEHFMAYEEQSIRDLDVLLDRMPRNLSEAFRLQRTILLGPDT